PDEFWATCGGMGLTGVIVEATIAMKRIESSRLLVDTDRIDDLDTLLDRLRSDQQRYRYSVAWIDPLARGRHLGRSILGQGDFAPASALPPGADPFEFTPHTTVVVPPLPVSAINHLTTRAF